MRNFITEERQSWSTSTVSFPQIFLLWYISAHLSKLHGFKWLTFTFSSFLQEKLGKHQGHLRSFLIFPKSLRLNRSISLGGWKKMTQKFALLVSICQSPLRAFQCHFASCRSSWRRPRKMFYTNSRRHSLCLFNNGKNSIYINSHHPHNMPFYRICRQRQR